MLVAVLFLLRVAASFVLIRHGLQASYFAAPQWTQPTVSRIDARLSFGGENDTDLPALSAVWQGYAPVQSGVDRQAFYLRGKGVTAELWVDGLQAVHLEPGAEEEIERAPWAAAMHHLIVRMTAAPGHSPQFDAGFVMTDGTKMPFGENAVLVKPAPAWRVAVDRRLRPLSTLLDGLLLAILAWGAWWTFPLAWRHLMRAVDFIVPPEEQ